MLTMLGAIATFEREMMLESQMEGIREAKLKGKFKGRKPTAREKSAVVMKHLGEGKTKKKIADELGIGIASVYRILKDDQSNPVQMVQR
jgi:DNA invertase Pin-like site-specific DNA recombinase